ncbi:MAG: PspC domain-containing protein [Bryobacteraceae bacterium]|nr:PspC domain-containing protein [Bryobacteraceae bacterium]MDW8376926.1 PspC domain-containing protein [Bryobacterales bacterium]
MFCTSCGNSLRHSDRFCAQCGAVVNSADQTASPAVVLNAPRRLERPLRDRKLAGVCAGFAHYFGFDVTLMRILWLVGTFYTVGTGIIVYLMCWAVMPSQATAPLATTAESPAPSSHPA